MNMEKFIKEYLKDNLDLIIREESYGFNGKQITITLELKGETIASDSYTIKQDEG